MDKREWQFTWLEWHMIVRASQDYLEQSRPELLAKMDEIYKTLAIDMPKGASLVVKAVEGEKEL